MSIVGIGTDIVDIKRIGNVIKRNGDRFIHKILTHKEVIQYHKHKKKIHFIAKRFAAKEATSKAFGKGICDGLFFTQFEVYKDKFGKPYLRFFSKAAKLANILGINKTHITLTDEQYYACAVVIFENSLF